MWILYNMFNWRVENFNNLLYLDVLTHNHAYIVDSNEDLEYNFKMFNKRSGKINDYGMEVIFNYIKNTIDEINIYNNSQQELQHEKNLLRAVLLSGVGVRNFFSASQERAKEVAESLLDTLNIISDNPEQITQQLIATPWQELLNASVQVENSFGFRVFTPVVERSYPDVKPILLEEPEELLDDGQRADIPLLIGFTNMEGQLAINNFREENILDLIKKNPLLMLSPDLIYRVSRDTALDFAEESEDRYFKGKPTIEKYVKCFSDISFIYPAIYLARSARRTSLYKFSYNADFSAVKETKRIQYQGAAHIDDLTFIFRTNSMKGIKGFDNPTQRDVDMRKQMVQIIKNFMSCE